MSIVVVVMKIMTFFYKMRACRPSLAGLCITMNSIGLGSAALAGNGLLLNKQTTMLIVQYFSSYDNAYRYKGQKRVQLVKKVATVWFTFDFSRLSKTKV